jgi:hypothetical protein
MKNIVLMLLCFLAGVVFMVHSEALRNPLANDVEIENKNKPAPKPKLKACWKDGEPRGAGSLPEKETKQCPKVSSMLSFFYKKGK